MAEARRPRETAPARVGMDAPGGQKGSAVSPPTRHSDTGNTGNTGNEIAVLVDAELTDTAILATLGRMELGREKFKPSEWRIEVFTNRNGRRYWNYRRRGKRGGKENYSYGGTFETLTDELRDAYRKRPKAQG